MKSVIDSINHSTCRDVPDNFYFYKNQPFETPYKLFTCTYQRIAIIRCMARFAINDADLLCMDPFVVAGRKGQQPEEILLAHLHHYVYLECSYYLVDMECIGPWSH